MEKLAPAFIEEMRRLLGEDGLKEYLDCFQTPRYYGLRVNTSKVQPDQFRHMAAYHLEPVPWCDNGFYYDGEQRPAKDPWYYAGLYYLQEPSAMAPAALLPIAPGNRVLDLCAAPGGKSTELGIRLKGEGILVSNDISNSRAKALLKNLELWGIPNICVTSEEPSKLSAAFPEFFDRILIDAPCSGEGMFRKDPDMVKSYEERGPEYYGAIQKEILKEAACMLSPGGLMLYSTCTFSECEDEGSVKYLLETRPDMELVELPLFEGAQSGFGLSGCIRLFPHKIKGEGHFIALLRKKEETVSEKQPAAKSQMRNSSPRQVPKLPQDFYGFMKNTTWNLDESRILIKNQQVYYLPEALPDHLQLRYLRTGLLLGELKKDRFEPGQAFAMALKPQEFKQILLLSKEDDRVIRYLKGETLALKPEESPVMSWCLVCVDGYPLGFAKGTGMSLKNKYYPGWRWQ